MKKKSFSYVLSMVLLLALFAGMMTPASAAASATLSVANVQAYPGSTITVDVSLSGAVSGLQITLEYDASVLTPEKIVAGPQCPGGWLVVPSEEPTMGRFVASGSLASEAIDGVVARYTYKVNQDAALGSSSLRVVTAIMSDGGTDFNAMVSSHGSVTVVSGDTGDADDPVPPGPAVTAVTVAPSTVSVTRGTTRQFNATVTAEGGAPEAVSWQVTGSTNAGTAISADGLLTVAAGEPIGTLYVVATSTFDSTKQATATVTVTSGGGTPPSNSGSTSAPVAEVSDEETPLADTFPFTDVAEGDWFYGDVYYMWENDLMNGTSDTLFSPGRALTRGMVVTVLYRMESEPSVDGLDNPFSDVAEGIWYTDAIKWAADKKIILGYGNDNFGPDDNITREQMAAILYRYQQFTEDAPPDAVEEIAFADEGDISDYAKDPVKALVIQGIINGKPNNRFDPKGNATRAEFAAMLHRYAAALE
ncbi:MAG: S-layer homology domain-containing protein [Oscillospiraceae bacterium]|nr:S-layer homology domain-containing protein [Oscillospiraceae bacterium]